MADIDQVAQIDRLSFSLPWPVSAYRYEVEENLRSSKLVAEIPSDFAVNSMSSQQKYWKYSSASSAMSPSVTANEGNPGIMINNGSDPDDGNDFFIVGMIVIWMIVDEAHIATIAVHPNFRRQGIAKILVTAGLAEAVKHEMRTATLEVRAGNLAAQALYRQFGFDSVGIRPRYYKDNANGVTAYEDAIIMTRRLD
jgi:ribosomal-protein-alanine N-acetyltransferase